VSHGNVVSAGIHHWQGVMVHVLEAMWLLTFTDTRGFEFEVAHMVHKKQ
jgi:hypothetical protein